MSLFQSTMTSVCFMFHTCLDFTWFFWFLKSIPVTEKISEILMNTITHSDVMTSCFFLQKNWCLTSLGHKQLHPIDKCCDKWLFSLNTKSFWKKFLRILTVCLASMWSCVNMETISFRNKYHICQCFHIFKNTLKTTGNTQMVAAILYNTIKQHILCYSTKLIYSCDSKTNVDTKEQPVFGDDYQRVPCPYQSCNNLITITT